MDTPFRRVFYSEIISPLLSKCVYIFAKMVRNQKTNYIEEVILYALY